MNKLILAAIPLTLMSTPALADTRGAANDWEKAYIALNIVDTIQTASCLDRHPDWCEEANPLFGKHPSVAKMVIGKALLVGLQYAIFERIRNHDPKAAMRFAQIGVGLSGTAVVLNARYTF